MGFSLGASCSKLVASRAVVIGCGAVIGAVAVLLPLLGCETNEQEQAALSVVSDGIALIETKSVAKAMNLTTKDLLVQPGRLNRKAVGRQLMSLLRAHGDIVILHPCPEIDLVDSGEAALVSMPFVVAKKGTTVEALDDLYDDPEAWASKASGYTEVRNVEISLVRENDRWLVRTVRF